MIITAEVQETLDTMKKLGDAQTPPIGDDIVATAKQALRNIDEALGDNLDRWYGAFVADLMWMSWFSDFCMAFPGGPIAAYEFLPAPQAVMLMEQFISTHPLTKLAIETFGHPMGEEVPRAQMEDIEDKTVAAMRAKMEHHKHLLTETPLEVPDSAFQVDGDKAMQLLQMLGVDTKEIKGNVSIAVFDKRRNGEG